MLQHTDACRECEHPHVASVDRPCRVERRYAVMWILFLMLFILLAIGAPIGVALGVSALTYWIIFTDMHLNVAPAVFIEFVSSYTLMAAPFFILAGMLMERSQLLTQLFHFADSCFGWIKGGMGIAALATAVVFAALTGSAVAAASALSLIVIPRMVNLGYRKEYAGGLVCAGGTLAELIPPSIWLILYGVITDTSVASLFFAGVMPGLALATLLIILNLFLSRNQPVQLTPFDIRLVLHRLKYSLPGLGMPVIVLGGLYGGVFTPTEAGAAACAYAILYGYISTKGRFTKTLLSATRPALKTSAMLFFLLGCVGVFESVASNQYWPQDLTSWAVGLGLTPLTFTFGYMAVVLLLGCFLDGVAIIALTVPVIFPVAQTLGVHPLHLGILLVVNCQLGTITPPLGLNLYAVSGVSKIPVYDILRATMPFFVVILLFLALMVFTPQLATWLPEVVVKPVEFVGLRG